MAYSIIATLDGFGTVEQVETDTTIRRRVVDHLRKHGWVVIVKPASQRNKKGSQA